MKDCNNQDYSNKPAESHNYQNLLNWRFTLYREGYNNEELWI